ncbi:SDR family oxidoreductase [uncultured Draconibacterium sp.]|uniref:SDR family NAD(P)-dependent oxidoreductase n=1 Tax=uncultured Draconibacterium sp. TaxID=1573823 RepID=UPI0025E2AB77|nr:SDR family oxidoreductase [uncultured Draconibacterium sp.]
MNKIEQLYGLSGKTIIVTGASSGLGLSMAILLAQCGAKVYGFSRRGVPEKELDVELPGEIIFEKLDVTDNEALAQKFKEVADANNGTIDVLVNNAGVTIKKRAEDFTVDDWKYIHDINVTALFQCCQKAYPYLKMSKDIGRIINISSMASFLGFSEVVPYSSSKSAVLGITKGLAVEWAQDNILVNSVSPGWFPSEMTQGVMDENRKAKILNRMPLHRFGKPEELAAMIGFLASPAASYITGQDFSVDGGALAYGF